MAIVQSLLDNSAEPSIRETICGAKSVLKTKIDRKLPPPESYPQTTKDRRRQNRT